MTALLTLFLNLCLLRAKPQDLPASGRLMGAALAAYFLAGWMIALTQQPAGPAVLAALADSAVLALLTHTVLLLRKHPERLAQTLSALAGTGAVIQLIAWPLLATPALLALLVWNLAINAHILRHALEVRLGPAILISVGFLLMSVTVALALAPLSQGAN